MITCDGCTGPIRDDDDAVEGVTSIEAERAVVGNSIRSTPVYYHADHWDRHPLSVSLGRGGKLKDIVHA